MTGIFIRIERGGRWVNLDVSEMSGVELEAAMHGRDPEELVRWILALGEVVRCAVPATADASEALDAITSYSDPVRAMTLYLAGVRDGALERAAEEVERACDGDSRAETADRIRGLKIGKAAAVGSASS